MDFDNNKLDEKLKDKVSKCLEILVSLNNKLSNIYKLNSDDSYKSFLFKNQNYNKWIRKIKSLDDDIFKDKDKLLELKSSSLKKKIKEINDKNTLAEIDILEKKILELEEKQLSKFNKDKSTKNNTFKKIENIDIVNLIKINGIAEKSAGKLLTKGIKVESLLEEYESLKSKQLFPKYKNIEELFSFYSNSKRNDFIKKLLKDTKYLKELNYNQIVGLKYYKDIQERIPRKEIEQFEKVITIILKKYPNIIFKICGSYRRGNLDSGDIDILISNKESDKSCILSFVKILIELDILVDHLTINGENKYMGLGKIPNNKYKIFRRIDIKYVNISSFATSLLYFTGSRNLNTEMRSKAISKGYKLNEYGLFWNKKDNKKQLDTPTEESVFKHLDMEYLEPIKRNI